MSEMLPNNPLFKLMHLKVWNWVQFALSIPVVFYATWMFFERAWRSIISWKLNMFTLIGIGAGVAWLFSVLALLRSEEHTSELQSLMRISYAVFCLKKKKYHMKQSMN